MKHSAIVSISIMLAFGPQMAVADSCDDLVSHANGIWPVVEMLPAGKVVDDGPWYPDNSDRTNLFTPHLQSERTRLLDEAKGFTPETYSLLDAYLSASQADFNRTMDKNLAVQLSAHRWNGTSLTAIGWVLDGTNCEADWAFLYEGRDQRIHPAKSPRIIVCDGRGSGYYPAGQGVTVDGRFALMDERRFYEALPSDYDVEQNIAIWRDDHFDQTCTLHYYHDVEYVLSDQTRYVDEVGHARAKNDFDTYLASNYTALLPEYYKAETALRNLPENLSGDEKDQRKREAQMTIFDDLAKGRPAVAIDLKTAYDSLREKDFLSVFLPVDYLGKLYFVHFQQASMGGSFYPYLDVKMYAIEKDKAMRVGNITIERKPLALRKVEVVHETH